MGFLMGLLVGTFLGMVIMSLCIVGGGADEKKRIESTPSKDGGTGETGNSGA